MAKKLSTGDRFQLLIYQPLGLRWRSLGILLTVLSLVLWWFAPEVLPPSVGQTRLRHLAFMPIMVGLLLTFYGIAAMRRTNVQCFAKHLRIQTPFYPLVVSYKRIESVRSVTIDKIFDRKKEKQARKTWPRPYWAKTAVVVELNSFPLSERWLRLWIDRYLFLPDVIGFVFLVDDWMTCSNQIEGYAAVMRERMRNRY